MKLSLHTPIEELYMVGESYGEKLTKYLNIHTVQDLLYHFPFRYDDLSAKKTLAEIQPGETVTLEGQILALKNVYTRNGKQIQQGLFTDGENTIEVTWFNQSFLTKTLVPGTRVSLAGKVATFGRKLTLTAPKYEIIKGQPAIQTAETEDIVTTHTGRLVPVYAETFGVSSKWLRSRINPLIKQIDTLVEEWLPQEILNQENLQHLALALKAIHFPESQEDIIKSRKRLAFDEMLLLQLQMQQRKHEWKSQQLRHKFECQLPDLDAFFAKLPFTLTSDQQAAIGDIITDFNGSIPMNRLLEGDVGSGKTVVAAAAIFLAHHCGVKSVCMAPTEVLANQHLHTLTRLLEPHGITLGFYTGSAKSKGPLDSYDVYLGTHALLFQDLPQEKIGLAIIDEQHRFGVEQRAKLIGTKILPHVLTMTATPIPRTVALTLYGDLSLSLISTMPMGRKQVKTWVVPHTKRQAGYEWIKKEILEHKTQAYFIYPLIDPSEKTAMSELKAAKAEYEKLTALFPDLRIGLLHGKMKSKDKDAVMTSFAKHELDILVATSVIEVGIDVANATIIVIEGAERFGLSQLHQLRGRVGRSDKQSYCLLLTTGASQNSQRLKAMETTHSGIALAELDLKLRGPGELYGTMQSGFLNLKIASLDDAGLIAKTHRYAAQLLPKLVDFPLLQNKLNACTISHIQPS